MSNRTVPAPPQFASKFGYSQARRVGDFIAVSGTPARDAAGAVVGEGNAYAQARQALENVKRSVEALGGRMQHVVRTRIYLIDMAHVWDIGRAHLEFFGGIDPATSLIKVTGFFDPKILLEIDCDAMVVDE
ncbi:MAG: Rid family hydrolase [Immundisolibacter sp.]|uniref:Rid family hydrolase n=1 Tax=Immundisolibacter sp. TaxID=1934948 RepID=UPI003EE29AC9